MTSIEEHKKKILEHFEEIKDAIEQGIDQKPVTIGFHCSACSLQLLEMYLHLINKIPMGKIIKHEWFKKPKEGQKKEPLIERKLPVSFSKKHEVYDLIYNIEEERNSLMYGKPNHEQIKRVLYIFNKLDEILKELLKNEGYEF